MVFLLTEKEFLQEIETAFDERKKFVEKIAAHGLPIFIFGAGNYAKEITDIFNSCGFKVDGYLVDENYYIPNKFYLNRPVYNFSEILTDESKRCVVLRGVTNRLAWKNAKERLIDSENFVIYEFIREKFYTLTYDEIVTQQDKFFETYNILSDELSRKTLMIYLKAHLSWVSSYLESIFQADEYFNELTRNLYTGGGGGIPGLRSFQR